MSLEEAITADRTRQIKELVARNIDVVMEPGNIVDALEQLGWEIVNSIHGFRLVNKGTGEVIDTEP